MKHCLAERYEALVIRKDGDECWGWSGSKSERGYGKISIGGRNSKAHRASWILHKGAIPEGAHVLHRCDNPPCSNPSHLFLGNDLVNAQDRAAKGRNGDLSGDKNGSRKRPECRPIGEQQSSHKLTVVDVVEMRRRRAAGESITALSAEFGVGLTTGWKAIRGVTWKHIA